MPRATHPLTPASSTDIQGQDGTKHLATLQMSFELPPPAMHHTSTTTAAALETSNHSPPATSDSSAGGGAHSPSKPAFPLQVSESVKSRRRVSTATATKNSFALPPPPTRSRKIIQMKPRAQDDAESQAEANAGTGAKGAAKPPASTAAAGGSPASKKKQPSATSVAGRKIARKTAHSLIERRRRSKMNEEFATLKSMVPACTGEMHKLAILQASIEYVRYLEDCVAKLKAQREGAEPTTPTELGPPPALRPSFDNAGYPDPAVCESPDVEMTDTELPSPTFTAVNQNQSYGPQPSRSSKQSSISPALLAEDARRRNSSYSSVSTAAGTAEGRHYSFTSSTTSPAFGPQASSYAAIGGYSHPGSTLTSPALQPQSDLDQEATAALLMLNSDRRGTGINTTGTGSAGSRSASASASASARGMSVRDLLST